MYGRQNQTRAELFGGVYCTMTSEAVDMVSDYFCVSDNDANELSDRDKLIASTATPAINSVPPATSAVAPGVLNVSVFFTVSPEFRQPCFPFTKV